MGVKSEVIIVCVVMSIVLQMASTDNEGIGKPMDSKVSRKKRLVGTILTGISVASGLISLVTDLFRSGRTETEKAVEEVKTMMKTETMSEIVHGGAEMLLAALEAKMKMDASSATVCSGSWLVVSCVTLLVALNLP